MLGRRIGGLEAGEDCRMVWPADLVDRVVAMYSIRDEQEILSGSLETYWYHLEPIDSQTLKLMSAEDFPRLFCVSKIGLLLIGSMCVSRRRFEPRSAWTFHPSPAR